MILCECYSLIKKEMNLKPLCKNYYFQKFIFVRQTNSKNNWEEISPSSFSLNDIGKSN